MPACKDCRWMDDGRRYGGPRCMRPHDDPVNGPGTPLNRSCKYERQIGYFMSDKNCAVGARYFQPKDAAAEPVETVRDLFRRLLGRNFKPDDDVELARQIDEQLKADGL